MRKEGFTGTQGPRLSFDVVALQGLERIRCLVGWVVEFLVES